jgi:hypothetical protein
MAEHLTPERAQSAYQWLKTLKNREALGKVKQRAQGLPVEVRTQGLSVVVATLIKEDRPESRELARGLADWLLGESVWGKSAGSRPGEGTGLQLLDRAIGCSRPEYLMLQAEALAYLEHVKRLASALEIDT